MSTNSIDLPSNLYVQVIFLHPDNSTREERTQPHHKKASQYVTLAKIKCKVTKKTICQAAAYCSNRDTPSRKLGRAIAVGRVMKIFDAFQADIAEALDAEYVVPSD